METPLTHHATCYIWAGFPEVGSKTLREVRCLVPRSCWQGEGESGSWPWRAFSDLGWPPLCCGCHENLNGDMLHSGQKGLCLSVIYYSVVLYPWSQSKMGKWTRLQGPRTPLSSWLGSHGQFLQLDMLESWLRPAVSLSVGVRKGQCWEQCGFHVIMYALCQVERWHSIGNWDSPRLCLSWDCRCGAAGAIQRAACTPLFYWKAEAVTCMSHSFIFLIHVGSWIPIHS